MTPIRKRGSVYWLDTSINGKRHRVSLGTDNYFLALHKSHSLERELGKAAKFGPSVTLADFQKKYMTWAWASKPISAEQDRQRLDRIVPFLAGQGITLLSEVTPYHVEQIKGWLRADGRAKSTVNRYLQLMRGLYYRAIEWGDYASANPLRHVKFYREQIDVHPLTDAQIQAVLAAARSIAASARSPLQRALPDIIVLALNTGLRKMEALNLRWKDMRGSEITVTGKGDKRRQVPLNADARAVIMRQPRGTEFVFDVPNRNQPTLLYRTVKNIEKRVGFHFGLHALRHSFATRLLKNGADIITLSSILGHGRSMTTLLYSHTDPDRKRAAVNRAKWGVVTANPSHGENTSSADVPPK